MRLRASIAGSSNPVAFLIKVQFPNYGTVSSNTDFGIFWKDPNDHTKVFGVSDGYYFDQGFNYTSIDFNTFLHQSGQSGHGLNGPDVYNFKIYSVNSVGADVALVGNGNGLLNLYSFGGLSFAASALTVPWSGLRLQLTFTTGSGDTTVTVPQIITFFGSP